MLTRTQRPWIHWLSSSSGDSSDFTACFTTENEKSFKAAPYLTQPGQEILSRVNHNPNDLEDIIINGISNWFVRRQKLDFFDSTQSNLLPSPANIPRWVAHLFLTTTVNIAAAMANSDGSIFIIPLDHFYDHELLYGSSMSDLLASHSAI